MKLKLKVTVFCIMALMLAGIACAETVISVPAEGPGEDGSMPVMVSGVSGVTGVSFLIEFDKDNLAVESASLSGPFVNAGLTPNINNDAGTAKFVIITTSEVTAEDAAELMNIKFTVADSADKTVSVTEHEWSGMDFMPHAFDSVIDGSPEPAATATATPDSSSSSSGGTSYAPATSTPTSTPTEVSVTQTPQPEKTMVLEETEVSEGDVPVVAANPDVGGAEGTGGLTGDLGAGNTDDANAEMTGGAATEPTGTPSVPGFGIVAALLSVVFVAVIISGRH